MKDPSERRKEPELIASVILPFFDAEATLPAALEGLSAQRDAPSFEILLIDNGSNDEGAALARSFVAQDPRRRRCLLAEQPGSYHARNVGLEAASGRYLLFLDADCSPGPHWVRTLVAALEAGAGLVGGPVQARGDRAHWLARYAQRVEVLAQEGAMAHPRGAFLQTANLGVEAERARAIGGFTGELPTGGDADFCWRLFDHDGTRPKLLGPAAMVAHWHRESLGGLWRQYRRYGQADVLLWRRHGGRPLHTVLKAGADAFRLLLWPLLALVALPVALVRKDPLPVLRPCLRAFRALARRRGQWHALWHPDRLYRS